MINLRGMRPSLPSSVFKDSTGANQSQVNARFTTRCMSMSHVCESQNIGAGAGNRYGRHIRFFKGKRGMAMGLSGAGGLSDIANHLFVSR